MMKRQHYDILEPFSKDEIKPTLSQILTVSSLCLMGLIALIEYALLKNDSISTISVFLLMLTLAGFLIGTALAFIIAETRNIPTIGSLTFFDNHIDIDGEIIPYNKVKYFDFSLSDYQGRLKLIRIAVLGEPVFSHGGKNYFTVTTENETLSVRFRLKSKESWNHINYKLKPWLKKKITNANNGYS